MSNILKTVTWQQISIFYICCPYWFFSEQVRVPEEIKECQAFRRVDHLLRRIALHSLLEMIDYQYLTGSFCFMFPGSNKITPYLENIACNDMTSGGQHGSQPASNITPPQKSPHVRRAKWHLGIRSQSRPGKFFFFFFILNDSERRRTLGAVVHHGILFSKCEIQTDQKDRFLLGRKIGRRNRTLNTGALEPLISQGGVNSRRRHLGIKLELRDLRFQI